MRAECTYVKIFQYRESLDAFVVTEKYKDLADRLDIVEWNPVVWIGRFFALDNDYGEHWFDNWDEREAISAKAKKQGLEEEEVMIIRPTSFKNDYDGPCHSDEQRKRFWADVLKSLRLSLDTIFNEARTNYQEDPDKTVKHYSALELTIKQIKKEYNVSD
jgi:hypothetical protein